MEVQDDVNIFDMNIINLNDLILIRVSVIIIYSSNIKSQFNSIYLFFILLQYEEISFHLLFSL